jgi:microcompartment protein CcmL/EutN
MSKSIGILELSSIAAGIQALDAMLKRAQIEVVEARMTCIGKYLAIVTGDVAAVKSAIETGRISGGDHVIEADVIASIADGVLESMHGVFDKTSVKALGILETKTLAAGFLGADTIRKAANVKLLKLHTSLGLGGKAVVLFTGDVASVENALRAGVEKIGNASKIKEAVAIPSPDEGLIQSLK